MTDRSFFLRPLLLGGALALLATAPARADTLLQLGETATVMVAPDELAANLRVEIVTAAAAEAQNRVNATIRDALAIAKRDHGITVSTGAYSVWRTNPTPQDRAEKWRASQNLMLSSKDGAALLTLVGELQQKGMVVSSLGWRLSQETYRKARQDATRQALSALRGRVDEAAGLLDLKFDHFKAVTLDSANAAPAPRPMALAAHAMARAAPVEPSAAAEDMPVSATAQADAVLVPR